MTIILVARKAHQDKDTLIHCDYLAGKMLQTCISVNTGLPADWSARALMAEAEARFNPETVVGRKRKELSAASAAAEVVVAALTP